MKTLEDIIKDIKEKRDEEKSTLTQLDKLASKQIRLEEEIDELIDSLVHMESNK